MSLSRSVSAEPEAARMIYFTFLRAVKETAVNLGNGKVPSTVKVNIQRLGKEKQHDELNIPSIGLPDPGCQYLIDVIAFKLFSMG